MAAQQAQNAATGAQNMFIVTEALFLLPFSLLCVAWRRSVRSEIEAAASTWRTYFGKAALAAATCSTLLEAAFFFSWFHNGGGPHGMTPTPGLWKTIGRFPTWLLVASVILSAFGKGKWRLLILAWAAALVLVAIVIFMLEMD